MEKTATSASPNHSSDQKKELEGIAKTDSQDFRPSESCPVTGNAEETKTFARREKITIIPFRVRNDELTLHEFEIF